MRAPLVEAGEDVEGEAEEFEGEEEDEQVLSGDEEDHAGGGEEDQEDELADVVGEGGVGGEEEGEDGEGEEGDLDEVSEGVGDKDAIEEGGLRGREEDLQDGGGAAEGAEGGGEGEAGVEGFCSNRQVNCHHDEGGEDEDDLRRGEADELGVGSGDHCQLPERRGAKSGELSAG